MRVCVCVCVCVCVRVCQCQCLVVQRPRDNMSKKIAMHTNDPRSLQIKATRTCEVIHACMPRKLGGIWACGHVSSPGCPGI